MNITPLASATLISPSAPVVSISEGSAQAESSAGSFLLSTAVADSLPRDTAGPVTENGLSAEKAQPLLDSLQAQFAYREANGPRQSTDRLALETETQPLANLPVLDLPLNTVKRRVSDEPVTRGNSTTTEAALTSEPLDEIAVPTLYFFPQPAEHLVTGQSEHTSQPLPSADGMPSPLVVEHTPAEVSTAVPSSATAYTAHTPSLKTAGQDALTLPLTLSRDQTGYAQPLVTALSGHITWQLSQQQQSVELQLHPAELGAMTITLHMNASALQLHIHAEVPETQQLLQQTANDLKESLTLSQGGQVAVDVSSQGHQQRRQTPQPQHFEVISANHLSVTDTQASATDHSILITL
ncbi:flagellar hook-length control protein FliK [Rosenbergiella epipactidis]|uniref:flagellar hook-length control protein FliK n=1 Tax=Rosenbergiella epipactidis TaxID=1544694 RepID=UPI001F4E1241|nr:flagellar hook-length control protein FliK [Rosenbergiella epipactidis]